MNEAGLLAAAAKDMRASKITVREWIERVRNQTYPWEETHIGEALLTLEKVKHVKSGAGGVPTGHGSRAATAPLPAPSPYGTKEDAGPFAGRGIMLGGNADVWDQALGLARADYLEVVAFPAHVNYGDWIADFNTAHCQVVEWCPPEREPTSSTSIRQAESQFQWNEMIDALTATLPPRGAVLNHWRYGRLPGRSVALVELYANEPGLTPDFGVFKNYAAQGAAAVIPLCGGYATAAVADTVAAEVYFALSTWPGGPFPGFWIYAGESPLTPLCVNVLKAWRG